MEGWVNPIPIKPVIIVYTAASIEQVKAKFGELIIKNNLTSKGPFKCVGSRISPSPLNINSYWSDFNRKRSKADLPNLSAYLHQLKTLIKIDRNIKESRKLFLEIFCKVLKLCRIKNPITTFFYTPYSLMEFLNETNNEDKIKEINVSISNWVIELIRQTDIEISLTNFIEKFITFFGTLKNEDVKRFLTDKIPNEEIEKVENKVYTYKLNNHSIDIQFNTIHGVKGETHTATLYLECFLRVFDIGGKIIKFIASDEKEREKLRKEDACKKQLPMAYVALTRATHFFAIAINKERFGKNYKEYFEENADFWELCYL
jgi:DNA helicase II / ATP-dependent DNA helicase PcrA